ncbi:MAG: phosphoglucosamine mutase [Bacteroidia bacterium]|nr:phosphoglucosamine mutase [Bacteroidia bacterium]GIV22764.1 MAG: phosphoglucosamine mutase [Bacteroidia bacterium]
MTLIFSASGLRGTIGGRPGENLTPIDAVQWAAAWGYWHYQRRGPVPLVIGQDARPSGIILRPLVGQTLRAFGHTVLDVGLTTTPTLEMAIPHLQAQGGVILTASHNPAGWNALKFLNEEGEFLAPEILQKIAALKEEVIFPAIETPGPMSFPENLLTHHIQRLLARPEVLAEKIARLSLRIVVDGINSGGAIAVPALLEALGVRDIYLLNGEPNGHFAHPPEPLPENLTQLAEAVRTHKAHLGIAVDPDVDRVAFFLPTGEPFGEEYTLVAVADYILSRQKGPVVTNQSTTLAVRKVAEKHGVPFYESRVGEYYVVQKMKAVGAVIGGEGNGGVIWPAVHYGRDALVGIALFLSALAEAGGDALALRAQYPSFVMRKEKLPLATPLPSEVWPKLLEAAPEATPSLEDGLKLSWPDKWIHLRASATEPLLRIIAEAPTTEECETLIHAWKGYLQAYL